MKIDRSYRGALYDEAFHDHPQYAIINDIVDDGDIERKGICNSPLYKRFWHLVKRTDINTNNLAKASISLNRGFDGTTSHSDWEKGKGSIFEVLDKLYDMGTRSFLLLGEKVYYAIIGDDISHHKMRGSYIQLDRYPGAYFLTTYHPRDINIKRYKTADGQAQLFLALAYDIEKWYQGGLNDFKLPDENFNIYPTIDEVEMFIYSGVKNGDLFGMDLETTSLNRYWGRIVMVGLAKDEENALCIPFLDHGGRPYFKPRDHFRAKKALEYLFQNGKHMWQNCLFDVPFLLEKNFRIDYSTLKHDTMLLHHAISPELPHDIGFITSLYGKTGYWKDDFLSSQVKILERDQEAVRKYNLRDCTVLHQILPGLLKDMEDNKQEPAYRENMRNIPGAIEQMLTGVVLNKDNQKKLRKDLTEKEKEAEKKLRTLGKLPDEFKLNSSDHLAYFLFGERIPQLDQIEDIEKKFESYTMYLYRCDNKKHKQWVKSSKDTKPCPYCGCETIHRDGKRETKEVRNKKIYNHKGEYTNKYKELLGLKNLRDNTRPIIVGKFFGKKNRDTNKVITDKQARAALHSKVIEEMSYLDKLKNPKDHHRDMYKKLRKLSLWIRFYDLYRLYQKQNSTYTKFRAEYDGRIHTNIKLHGTASGRPASSDPNLLNIPKKYKSTRFQFGTDPNRILVSFDYSNIEAKMLAYITEDERFIKAVNSGNLHDINTRTLFHIEPDHPMWKLARRAAKIFQFGYISYGGQPKTIWEQVCIEAPGLNLSLKEFKEAGERYFSYYDDFRKWREKVEHRAIHDRYTISPFGRIRYLYGGENDRIKQAYNHPPQSGAAFVMNTAMIESLEKIKKEKIPANLQIQIYDDLRFEVNRDAVGDLIKAVVPIMEQTFTIKDTERWFETDIEMGETWGDLHEIDKNVYLGK